MYQTNCTAQQIRQSFFNFFKEKKHCFIRSSPVNATGDPTLLFTNAGMNQFKSIFLGDNVEGLERVYNSQKCIRISGKHNDLEVVGKDTFHHTFFEMLGNWSFDNYGKQEAILWSWELLTKVWKIPKERLFVTVHHSDEEAKQIWKDQTDIASFRVIEFGDKDNFWEMGDVGPCGPCSEIHYDKGSISTQGNTYSHSTEGVNGENDRYIEIWNLVFIQFQRLKNKNLQPLKCKHVDTGMGFERICAVLQGVSSNYDIDLFKKLIQTIEEITNVPYSSGEEGIPHRVLADHIRTLAFAIADGVTLSNEGQGYVMRRLLRRASRYARKLHQTEPILYQLVDVLAFQMKDVFPEIKERSDYIRSVIQGEEKKFEKTLGQGIERFHKIVEQNKMDKSLEEFTLTGQQVFLLYDTYGFPFDLTMLMATEQGLSVDVIEYEKCMEEQNQRGRSSSKFEGIFSNDEEWIILNRSTVSAFIDNPLQKSSSIILRYRVEEKKILIVLDQTTFYPEGGGQQGDRGTLSFDDGLVLEVLDTFKQFDMIVHICEFQNKDFCVTAPIVASVDLIKRKATSQSHSCTHLLQQALIHILGDHVQQQGSMINDERLRFDFTHFRKVSLEELQLVSECVNQHIQENLLVKIAESSFHDAKKKGALALFSEKYGEIVRTIEMGEFSYELCGGTHVQSTGEIGCFVIIAENGIAAGVRRIDALTGVSALKYFSKQTEKLQKINDIVKVSSGSEIEKVKILVQKLEEQEQELKQLKQHQFRIEIQKNINEIQHINSIPYLFSVWNNLSKDHWKEMVDSFVRKLPKNAIFMLVNRNLKQTSIVCLVHHSIAKKIAANELIGQMIAPFNGKGGGKNNRAQAGIPPLKIIDDLKSHAEKVILDLSKMKL